MLTMKNALYKFQLLLLLFFYYYNNNNNNIQ